MVVNAGNANVFTGTRRARRLRRDRRGGRRASSAARRREVFVASTGVIGEVLPHDKLIAALPALHAGAARGRLGSGGARHHDDRYVPESVDPGGDRSADVTVRITGIAKGSGMIAPDMATMLCFVFTDADDPGAMRCRRC